MTIPWGKIIKYVGTLGVAYLLKRYRTNAVAKTVTELLELGVKHDAVPKQLQSTFDVLARAKAQAQADERLAKVLAAGKSAAAAATNPARLFPPPKLPVPRGRK